MIISSAAGDVGIIIDRDTGGTIPDVIWADTDTGWYEVVCRDAAGQPLFCPDTGELKTARKRGRIMFIRYKFGDD